jgi:cytochrome P450
MADLLPKTQHVTAPVRGTLPPGPHGHFLLGNVREIQRDSIGFNMGMMRQYGDIVRVRVLTWPTYMVFHPDDVKRVLQENHKNYNKDVYNVTLLKPLLGQGLFTNDGESWLQQRRLMQPAFHRKRLATFGSLMTAAATSMLEGWQNADQPLDVAAEMMRLTLSIAGQALFSINLSDEADAVGQAFTAVRTLLTSYLFQPMPPLSIPTPRNRRLKAAIHALDRVVQVIVNERRKQNSDRGDLLSMLMLARDEETGEGMSDRQVRDEVMTLLLAGHETTANTLTWTWYLLSQHPDVEHRLHDELDRVLCGDLPALEHLPQLHYTHMVIEEAIRLYSPVFGFGRKAIGEDVLGGYHVPANTSIWLSPYVTHRHPDFWEKPEVFDPERFSPERSSGRPQYAHFPFGGGPRLCIGSNFAMMEAQLVLATIAQRYRLVLVPGHRVEPEVLLTLRPRCGLPMTIHPREQGT